MNTELARSKLSGSQLFNDEGPEGVEVLEVAMSAEEAVRLRQGLAGKLRSQPLLPLLCSSAYQHRKSIR